MKLVLLSLLAVAPLAHADLYRWVDPQSGSIKLSNTPPPWADSGQGPAVERIPYSGPAAPPAAPQPAVPPARVPAQPARQGAAPSAAPPANAALLQTRWRDALVAAAASPSNERLERLGVATAELDKADPAGAERRREEIAVALGRTPPR